MGIYLVKAKKIYNGSTGLSFPQQELIRLISDIWNNQDNLTNEDIEVLRKLSLK